jgi:large subunit ribosomal protein L30
MSKSLRIRQVRSAINRDLDQKRTLRALGIRRMQQAVVQPDNPQIRGMVFKVRHLVSVEEIGD